MALELQQLVLDLLESSNEIKDTRTIVLPGENKPATSQDSQLLIQGALNSLLSREVCVHSRTKTLIVPIWGRLLCR